MSYTIRMVIIMILIGSLAELGHSQGSKPCFLVGNAPLPSDVKPNPAVVCRNGANPPFPTLPIIPDVEFGSPNSVKFSEKSFLNQPALSSVAFAITNFGNNTARTELVNTLTVYDAINAALRSVDNPESSRLLRKVKGVCFFLAFIINANDGDIDSTFGARRNFGKTVKNCDSCTAADRARLEQVGAGFGIVLSKT